MRFAIEMLKAVGRAVAAAFRFSQWRSRDFGFRLAGTLDPLAAWLEKVWRRSDDFTPAALERPS